MLSRLCIFASFAACLGGCDSKSPPKEVRGAAVLADEKPPTKEPSASPKVAQEHPPATTPVHYDFLQSKDRSEDDLTLDKQRNPVETLAFFGIRPKMRVAELAAGGGYTTEILARTVGPAGVVYGQNSPFILKRFAEAPWSERLKKPALKNVVRLDTEFDAPLPPSAHNLDAVLMVLFYHDTVWFKTDRAAMNKAVFQALKPGGIFGIIDHNAKEGDGVSQAQTLHRIEESVVISEITSAGFILDDSAPFLRNPDDARNWNASPSKSGDQRGESDRFVLRFKKPDAAASDAQH
jgi:predicted methyltransferase